MAELARSGFRPRGDLWLLAVADEEDGMYDVGMRWLLEARPDIRPDLAVNEGGGERLVLADGRVVITVGVGEKGTYPVRVTRARRGRPRLDAERRRQRRPAARRAAAPGRARACPTRSASPLVDARSRSCSGEVPEDPGGRSGARAAGCTRLLPDVLPALAGTTMAPTLLGGSTKRNVMPARAPGWSWTAGILPGTTEADVERAVRAPAR